MVKVDDAMGDQVLLVMEMNFLGRDAIRPIGLRMATKANRDLLDLDTLRDLEMQLTAKDGRFLGGGIDLVIAGKEEGWLRERDPHRNPTPRGDDLFVRKWRKGDICRDMLADRDGIQLLDDGLRLRLVTGGGCGRGIGAIPTPLWIHGRSGEHLRISGRDDNLGNRTRSGSARHGEVQRWRRGCSRSSSQTQETLSVATRNGQFLQDGVATTMGGFRGKLLV